MKKFRQKGVSILLVILLVLYPVGGVFAQETTSDQTATDQQTTDPSPSPTPTPEPSPTTEPSPAPSTEPSPTPSPSPSPTPPPSATFDPNYPDNHPPYSSPEYDEWKAQKEIWEQQQNQRDDEWEANEEDPNWVAAHGGDEQYYTSGQWEADQQVQPAATESEGSLGTTSDGSSVSSTVISSEGNTTTISNTNTLDMTNTNGASSTTGENTSSSNDGDVTMQTGDGSAEGKLVNTGNTNTTSGDNFDQSSSASSDDSIASGTEAENINTDDDSENLAETTVTNDLTVENNNSATVDNNMTVEGTSGVNEVTDNDGQVSLTTGDIELLANMLNILNLNVTGDDFLHLIINIFGTLTGDVDLDDIAVILGFADDDALEDAIEVIARNENTGDDSENTAIAEVSETTAVTNDNTATVNNEMNVTGVSGQNNVSGNDGNAQVITGRIQILANMLNFINTNFQGEKWTFLMVNIFGSLFGNIIVPGTESYLTAADGVDVVASSNSAGDGSNSATATSNETTSVSNTNNVSLTNTVNASGDSGSNSQTNNEGAGMLNGAVDIATQIINFLNFNITGNNFVLLIVNVFGTWLGQIIGFGDSPAFSAGEGTFAGLLVGSGQTAQINPSPLPSPTSGDGSVNDATATYTANTTVTNNNTATVNNTMNIEGVSGQNTMDQNDGVALLRTGWIEIDANLLNIINMSITGQNWLVVFLNVFGDFMGNLVFGRENVPVVAAATSENNLPQGGNTTSENTGSSYSQTNQNQASVQSTTSAEAQSGPGGDASVSVSSTTKVNTTSGQGNAGSNFEEESVTIYVEADTGLSLTPDTQTEESSGSWFDGVKNWIFNLWQAVSSSFNNLVALVVNTFVNTVYGKGVN